MPYRGAAKNFSEWYSNTFLDVIDALPPEMTDFRSQMKAAFMAGAEMGIASERAKTSKELTQIVRGIEREKKDADIKTALPKIKKLIAPELLRQK
jgi:hypothetical protein